MNEFNALETCKKFIDDELTPLLKANDFIKKRNSYFKKDSIDFKSISYSKGKFNSKSEVTIYFYISFTFEEIHNFFMPQGYLFDKYETSIYILNYPLWQFSIDDETFKVGITIDADWQTKRNKVLNLFKDIIELFDILESPEQYLNDENFNKRGTDKSDTQLRNIYYLILSSKINPQNNIKNLFSKIIDEFDGHKLVKEKLLDFGKQNSLV
ncbi:MAG: hypothetical protein ACK43K_04205 [Chitinophagales bacterium]|jgi:hypothetical protein